MLLRPLLFSPYEVGYILKNVQGFPMKTNRQLLCYILLCIKLRFMPRCVCIFPFQQPGFTSWPGCSGHPSYFGSLWSASCEDIVQDTIILIKGSWRFLNSVHLYMNKKKHLGHSFAFDAPTVRNDLLDEVHSAPTLACFRKRLKSYLFNKAFPT